MVQGYPIASGKNAPLTGVTFPKLETVNLDGKSIDNEMIWKLLEVSFI